MEGITLFWMCHISFFLCTCFTYIYFRLSTLNDLCKMKCCRTLMTLLTFHHLLPPYLSKYFKVVSIAVKTRARTSSRKGKLNANVLRTIALSIILSRSEEHTSELQ